MKKTDILFINPPGMGRIAFPYGISILSAILKKEGFSVGVVDAEASGMSPAAVELKASTVNPSVLGFTGLWKNFNFIKETTERISRKIPKSTLIAGGCWANPFPEIVFRETPVKYVVRGEAEPVIVDLCDKLLKGDSILDLPGVCGYDANGRLRIKDEPSPPGNLDDIPLPAYELFNMDYYTWKVESRDVNFYSSANRYVLANKVRSWKGLKKSSIYSGQGCFGKCAFCSAAGQVRRTHTPRYVADHMEKMSSEFGVNVFVFNESLSFGSKSWVKEFCIDIISRKLNVLYYAQSRGDFKYDNETLELLKDSGCIAALVGFESGDNEMLKKMGKNACVEEYRKLVSDFESRGIAVLGLFVLNMPGETKQSMKETLKFVKKSKVRVHGAGYASPYPGTELYRYAKKMGFIKDERDFILKNPARNKGRDNFMLYYSMFNFNNLPYNALTHSKKVLDRFAIINYFYYKNRSIY